MLNDNDLDIVTRTILSEAGNQGPIGQAAVAAVIANRTKQRGLSPSAVSLQRNQFEPWNGPGPNHPSKWDSSSPKYQAAADIARGVFGGSIPDPTKGATHFFAPGPQAALGRNVPAWGRGEPLATIGGHSFFAPEGKSMFDPMKAQEFWRNPSGDNPMASFMPGKSTPDADLPTMGAGEAGKMPPASPLANPFGGQQAQTGGKNTPFLGRMLFGDGGLQGMMGKIPTPGDGKGMIGNIFSGMGGAPAAASSVAPAAATAALPAMTPAAISAAAAPAAAGAAGAGGLGSALASLFAFL